MEQFENENIKKARLGFFVLFLPIAVLFGAILAPFAQNSPGERNDMARKVSKFKNDSLVMYSFSVTARGLQKRLLDTNTDTATLYRQIQGSLDSLKEINANRNLDTTGNHHFYPNILTSVATLKQSVIALRSKGQTGNTSDLKEQRDELQNSLNLCQLKQAK